MLTRHQSQHLAWFLSLLMVVRDFVLCLEQSCLKQAFFEADEVEWSSAIPGDSSYYASPVAPEHIKVHLCKCLKPCYFVYLNIKKEHLCCSIRFPFLSSVGK